jgi:hypothetical protein
VGASNGSAGVAGVVMVVVAEDMCAGSEKSLIAAEELKLLSFAEMSSKDDVVSKIHPSMRPD